MGVGRIINIVKKICALGVLLCVLAAAFVPSGATNRTKGHIVVEAGSAVPAAEEFFLIANPTAAFVTDIAALTTGKTGETKIELELIGNICTSLLIIEDTIPPTGKGVELYIFANTQLAPADLVTDVADATEVTLAFFAPPDFAVPGWQEVTVALTDEGGNVTKVTSRIYIFDIAEELAIEAGTASGISDIAIREVVRNFIEVETEDAHFALDGEIDFKSLGSYPMEVSFGENKARTTAKIQDTIPPTGEGVEVHLFKNAKVVPRELVKNIMDATKVTLAFLAPPDFDLPGWQKVTVALTDEGGNVAKIASRIYIFDIIQELAIEAGTKSRIGAADFIKNHTPNSDPPLPQLVIPAAIDFSAPGVYAVTLKYGAYEMSSIVKIQDTTPPAATVQNRRTYKNQPIPAESFVSEIKDASPVTVSYRTHPDFSRAGAVTVHIVLEDAYGNWSEYTATLEIVERPAPPPAPPPPAPLPSKPPVELQDYVIAGGITVIGDSVLLGAKSTMEKNIPNCYIDAKVSRQLSTAPGIMADLKARGALAEYVVIALGTNGAYSYVRFFNQIIEALPPGHKLILVTPFDGRGTDHTRALNEMSEWMRALPSQYDFITIADWNALISGHTELLARDRVHMGGVTSMQLYSDMIAEAINVASQKPAK